MKKQFYIFIVSLSLIISLHIFNNTTLTSVESIASELAASIESPRYNIKTSDELNMDCLKITKLNDDRYIAVFHSSAEQHTSYSGLYWAQLEGDLKSGKWTRKGKLSERGSQGYVHFLQNTSAILVLYKLENHEKGNTVAIRYYESYEKLANNNFLYEYQLEQKIDRIAIRNIGTVSIENITLLYLEKDPNKSKFNLTIKFHYSPDGKKDVPGYGWVDLFPQRDFVDGSGKWVGGCKQNYADWLGFTDRNVQQAISRVGVYSKIGQRDLFTLVENGKKNKYYLYQVNMNNVFDWKYWRIVLYSEKDNAAAEINFSFAGDEDVANPHINLLAYDAEKKVYSFFLSFFLPSEGVRPGTEVKPGEMTAFASIHF